MAIEDNGTGGGWRIPAMACTVPYLAGMVLIYVGEKLMESPLSARLLLDGLGAACLLWGRENRAFPFFRRASRRRRRGCGA